jgi:hypothetical protein
MVRGALTIRAVTRPVELRAEPGRPHHDNGIPKFVLVAL